MRSVHTIDMTRRALLLVLCLAFLRPCGQPTLARGGYSLNVALIIKKPFAYPALSRLSVSSAGGQASAPSWGARLSNDGRYVAFNSDAGDLVAGDDNGQSDVFVHDRETGETTRVSVGSAGEQGDGASSYATLSGDGRFVAFHSKAGNLVADDTNGLGDVFVHDCQTGQTTRVSVSSSGEQANAASYPSSLSNDGRYVVFGSDASNLAAGDGNGVSDVMVHDRQTGQTTRVSITYAGGESSGPSTGGRISADGRYVAFESDAGNLVPGDTRGARDVFVHDRWTVATTRVSSGMGGQEGNSYAVVGAISGDGRCIAFISGSSNLVPDDTNNRDDLFVFDQWTGQTSRASVGPKGQIQDGWFDSPSLSADCRYLAFSTTADILVAGDTNTKEDVLLLDRQTGNIQRVSVNANGQQCSEDCRRPALSGNGRYVVYDTACSALVPDDTNGQLDVFAVYPARLP